MRSRSRNQPLVVSVSVCLEEPFSAVREMKVQIPCAGPCYICLTYSQAPRLLICTEFSVVQKVLQGPFEVIIQETRILLYVRKVL